MSLLWGRRGLGDSNFELVPPRSVRVGTVNVNPDEAMKSSAVWACTRLRANLISSLPLDVYRQSGGVNVEQSTPPIFTDPAGDGTGIGHWLYASQVELDRYGNSFGVIHARDGLGLPSIIELVSAGTVTVKAHGSTVTSYRIGQKVYAPGDIWHEKQYVVAGSPVGLSPIAMAANSIGGYLSAQQFAVDWFNNGAAPGGHLKNTAKTLTPDEADTAKRRFKAAVLGRDVLTTGSDWEYTPLAAAANDAAFLEAMHYGIADIARFLDVPGDLIGAEHGGKSITYANITQRNLEFLIMSLGPTIKRREEALSRALSRPRFVKFNTDALLRMDPLASMQMIALEIDKRTLTNTEARALRNRAPLTSTEIAEFSAIYSSSSPLSTTSTAATGGQNDVTA